MKTLKEKILKILDKNLYAIESYETYPGTDTEILMVTGKSIVCDQIQELIISLLPSNEEIGKRKMDGNETYKYRDIMDTAYRSGQWNLRQEILDKLK